jgi:hypothetical protein
VTRAGRLRAAAAALLVAVACASLAGCSGRAKGGSAVRRSYQGAGGAVRLEVDRTSITVADTVLLIVEADAYEGSTVRLPESAAAEAGGLSVVDSGDLTGRPAGRGTTRSSRWFRLEPYLSGDYAVEPMSVEITDAAGAKRTVRTERIPIKVGSLLPKDYGRLEIKDIDGIVRARRSLPPWAWPLLGLLAAAGAGILAWLWWRRRLLEGQPAPPQPAHLAAYEELDSLVAENLVAHGEVKLFYQRVTGIVRRYVERRFGLRAPERTTEEFLWELREASFMSVELEKLLRAFLQHSDLVKFAELRPRQEEIVGALESCRDFIRATELEAGGPPRAV